VLLTELEKELFEDAENGTLSMSLQKAAFIASGIASSQVEGYLKRFSSITNDLKDSIKGHDKAEKARSIFNWLWKTKPRRYELGGNFKLTLVIDAQLKDTEKVGNCLGLTILYNSLAQDFNLPVKAAYLDNFLGFSHVFSIFYLESSRIPIENVFPNGFDYDPHKNNPRIVEWDNIHLVADIYNSRANDEDNDELRMKRDLLLSYIIQLS